MIRMESVALQVVILYGRDGVSVAEEETENSPGTSPEAVRATALTQTLAAAAAGSESQTGPHPAIWSHFRDLDPIGAGGFGAVYRAWDTQLHREVALKLIRPRNSDDDDHIAALQEARMMARVRHPNIVPVYGVALSDGRVGIWSELIDGESLAASVKQRGPMDPRAAAGAVLELCKAVGAMHAAGVLHRDIKAENALQDSTGRVLLTDFGLSRDPGSRLLGGTLPYMAPELFKGAPASAATDIYSLGVLLCFLVSGEFPLKRNSDLEQVRASQPKPFLDIVSRATDPHPESRFSTVEGMRLALDSFISSQTSVSARRLPGARVMGAIVLVPFAIAGALWFWLAHRSTAPSVAPTANAFYEQAHSLLERADRPGNAQASAALFEKAIAADPQFALAYAEMAEALMDQYLENRDDPALKTRASKAAEQALALNKDLPQALTVEGRLHRLSGEPALALSDFQRAIKFDPHNADAFVGLGQIYDSEGREDDAAKAFQKAIDFDLGNWRSYNQRGVWLARRGDLAHASEMFEKVVAIQPDNISGLMNLVMVRGRQQRSADARRLLEKVVRIVPDDVRTRMLLGYSLMLEGRYQEAASQYSIATRLSPNDYTGWAGLASATEFAGGIEKARPLYEKTIQLAEKRHAEDPKNAGLTAALGDYYAALGMREQAIPLLRNALALAPEDADVLESVSEGYEALGMREQALPLLTGALSRGYSPEMVKRIPELARLITDKRFRWPAPAQ